MMERCDKLRPLVILAALNLRMLMDDASLLGRRKQPAKRGFSSESRYALARYKYAIASRMVLSAALHSAIDVVGISRNEKNIG